MMRGVGSTTLPAAVLLAALGLFRCSSEPALLQVELDGGATASPQFFHGNCFAGFSVVVSLRVTETRGVDVVLDTLAFRISDQGSGGEIAAETLDSNTLEERYGVGASRLPGRSFRVFSLAGPASNPVGPLAVSGEVRGRDENDARVARSFQLTAPLRVEDPAPPAGGACSSP